MIGGQDELVFDGDSLIVDAEGELLARALRFEEDLFVTDLALPAARGAEGHEARSEEPGEAVDGVRVVRHVLSAEPVAAYTPEPPVLTPRADPASDVGEVYRALVVGVRDYARKNGFGSAAVALSGGIDSAVAITVAADALGADRVHALLLPSKYSSEHSVSDAEDLVERQGIRARTVEIAPIVAAFEEGIALDGVAAENLQARVRGTLLMGLSNQEGHLVLATGNKSELAVGYSTLYGDSVGGFAPIKDCWKSLVWELARWRNAEAERAGDAAPIPENSISKPPSAELRPGQLDSDSLPDYDLLDGLLDAYIGTGKGMRELTGAGYDPELVQRVIRMVDRAEYKRRQYPPGPKISSRNFGRDRRLPMTNRWAPRA